VAARAAGRRPTRCELCVSWRAPNSIVVVGTLLAEGNPGDDQDTTLFRHLGIEAMEFDATRKNSFAGFTPCRSLSSFCIHALSSSIDEDYRGREKSIGVSLDAMVQGCAKAAGLARRAREQLALMGGNLSRIRVIIVVAIGLFAATSASRAHAQSTGNDEAEITLLKQQLRLVEQKLDKASETDHGKRPCRGCRE
jgi:hypothetical protein